MIEDDDEKKKYLPKEEEEGGRGDDEGGRGSQGGQTGAVEFRYRDILSTDARDDVLPESEARHLLAVFEDDHKERVDRQKRTRKERDDIKNGRVQANNYDALGLRIGGGGGGGGTSPYKTHPLSNHAQFSGATDRKVTGVPSDSLAETNDDAKDKLINDYDLTYQHTHKLQNAPKFNPKPRPF
jgi:hypothetical protein